MDLDEAYRVLEVERGASEDVVREARKTLAKVWHPDRHANDPELQKRAESKLADVNAAFEVVSAAGFPKPQMKIRSATAPAPAAPPIAPTVEPPKPPSPEPKIELVPRRRIRWSVLFVLAAALGIGAYLAIIKLGGGVPVSREVVADAVAPDATVVVIVDAAEVRSDAPTAIVRREKTFTLGSTLDDVIGAQGQPQGTHTKSSTINGVRTASARLTYGESSTIDLDADDKVIGWAERDAPLHVRLDVRDPDAAAKAKARGMFAIGATPDEVLGVLGPPTELAGNRWWYGTSTLDFAAGKLRKVTQGEPKLPVAP